jgi:hypothetical protein
MHVIPIYYTIRKYLVDGLYLYIPNSPTRYLIIALPGSLRSKIVLEALTSQVNLG